MSDYEGPPLKWDWSPSIPVSDLKTKLSSTNSRLISVHRPDGDATVPYTAVWIASKGTDKTDWNWDPGTTASCPTAGVARRRASTTPPISRLH